MSPLRPLLLLPLLLVLGIPASSRSGEPPFPDCNADCEIDAGDVDLAVDSLFSPGPEELCPPLAANPTAAGLLGLVRLQSGPNADAPVVLPQDAYRTYPEREIALPIAAEDPDLPLVFGPFDLPDGAELGADGILRWIPAPEQLGPFYVPFLVVDGGRPPQCNEGTLSFRVNPPDPCAEPTCDPASGCVSALPPLSEPCCGEPAARVGEPEGPCPGSRVLMIGRNTDGGFGRLQNCDRLRLLAQSQLGVTVRIHLAARCVTTGVLLNVRSRLETDGIIHTDREDAVVMQPSVAGFAQRVNLSLAVRNASMELNDKEANLTVEVTDPFTDVVVTESLRLILTHDRLTDLPDVF